MRSMRPILAASPRPAASYSGSEISARWGSSLGFIVRARPGWRSTKVVTFVHQALSSSDLLGRSGPRRPAKYAGHEQRRCPSTSAIHSRWVLPRPIASSSALVVPIAEQLPPCHSAGTSRQARELHVDTLVPIDRPRHRRGAAPRPAAPPRHPQIAQRSARGRPSPRRPRASATVGGRGVRVERAPVAAPAPGAREPQPGVRRTELAS